MTSAESVSYAELNRRANRLAWFLRQECGVGAEQCVGLCVNRSVGMLVGMLGILKAGGAYVPLDPQLPAPLRELEARLGILATTRDPGTARRERSTGRRAINKGLRRRA